MCPASPYGGSLSFSSSSGADALAPISSGEGYLGITRPDFKPDIKPTAMSEAKRMSKAEILQADFKKASNAEAQPDFKAELKRGSKAEVNMGGFKAGSKASSPVPMPVSPIAGRRASRGELPGPASPTAAALERAGTLMLEDITEH